MTIDPTTNTEQRSAVVTLIGAIFIAYGGYGIVKLLVFGFEIWIQHLDNLLLYAVLISGGIGALADHRWSRFCAYYFTAAIIGKLLFGIATTLLYQALERSDTTIDLRSIPLLPVVTILAATLCSYALKRHFAPPVVQTPPKAAGLGKIWLLLLCLITMHVACALITKVATGFTNGAIEFSYRAYRAGNFTPTTYGLEAAPLDFWVVMIGYGLLGVGMFGSAIKCFLAFCQEERALT
jgi:hypothetical protein